MSIIERPISTFCQNWPIWNYCKKLTETENSVKLKINASSGTYIGSHHDTLTVLPVSYLEEKAKAFRLTPINWPIGLGKDFIKSKSFNRQLKWLMIWTLCVEIPEFSFWFWLLFRLLIGEAGFKHCVSVKLLTEIWWHFSKVNIAWLWSTICSTKMATETTIFHEKIFTPFFIPVIVKSWPVIVIEIRVLVGLHSFLYQA